MLVCVRSGWPVVSAELKSLLIHIDKVIYKVYYQCIKVRTATKVLKAKLSTVASRRKLPQTQQGEPAENTVVLGVPKVSDEKIEDNIEGHTKLIFLS